MHNDDDNKRTTAYMAYTRSCDRQERQTCPDGDALEGVIEDERAVSFGREEHKVQLKGGGITASCVCGRSAPMSKNLPSSQGFGTVTGRWSVWRRE
jgi:hypothetical protein